MAVILSRKTGQFLRKATRYEIRRAIHRKRKTKNPRHVNMRINGQPVRLIWGPNDIPGNVGIVEDVARFGGSCQCCGERWRKFERFINVIGEKGENYCLDCEDAAKTNNPHKNRLTMDANSGKMTEV